MQKKMIFQTNKQMRKNQANLTFKPITGSQQIKYIRNLRSERMVLPEESRNESQATNAKKSLETLRLFTHANWSKKGINQQSKKPIRCISTDLGSQKDKNLISKFWNRLFIGKLYNTVWESIILAGNLWTRCKVLALKPMSRVQTWLVLAGCS